MKLLIGFLCSFLLCYATCHVLTQDSIFCATPFHQHILLAWHSLQILDLSNSEFQFVATRQFAELNENQTQERLWVLHVKLVRHLNIHWVAFISEWNWLTAEHHYLWFSFYYHLLLYSEQNLHWKLFQEWLQTLTFCYRMSLPFQEPVSARSQQQLFHWDYYQGEEYPLVPQSIDGINTSQMQVGQE